MGCLLGVVCWVLWVVSHLLFAVVRCLPMFVGCSCCSLLIVVLCVVCLFCVVVRVLFVAGCVLFVVCCLSLFVARGVLFVVCYLLLAGVMVFVVC